MVTLAALISGLVASTRTQLPTIATQGPERAKAESRVKRFPRGVGHEMITATHYCLPSAEGLLAPLALPTLVLIMDGSGGTGGCRPQDACGL